MIEGADNSADRLRAIHARKEISPESKGQDDVSYSKNGEVQFSEMLGFLHPRKWHPAVSLALAAAAVGQLALIAGMSNERKAGQDQIAKLEKRVGDLEYQLASGPDGGLAKPDLLVQIKPDASWAALSDLLATEGLTIVDGPSDNSLSLSSELEGAALDALIERLRASGLIETADKAA